MRRFFSNLFWGVNKNLFIIVLVHVVGAVAILVFVTQNITKFIFDPAKAATPTISNISPNSGSSLGGTNVTITGTNFALADFNASWKGGGTGADQGNDVVTDSSDNVYVAGTFSGTSTFSGTNVVSAGNTDAFLAKYNSSNVLQWVVGDGGTGADTGTAVTVDSSGNVYVAGSFSGTATFGTQALSSSGNTDVYLAKYNSSGVFQWAVKGGGTGADVMISMTIDSSGNPYVAGSFTTSITFGSTVLSGTAAIVTSFITKYNPSGVTQWARAITTNTNQANHVVANGTNLFVVGQFSSTVNATGMTAITSTGSTDIYVSQIDFSGTFLSLKKFGSTAADVGLGIDVDSTGNICMTGSISGSTNFDGNIITNSSGSSDVFVVKLNSSNTTQWARRAGSSNADQGTGVMINSSGECIATGVARTAVFGTLSMTTVGNNDMFVVKYDSTGTPVWLKSAGSTSADQGQELALTSTGGVIVVGFYAGTTVFTGTTLTTSGGNDVFITKISQTTTVSIGGALATNVNIVSATSITATTSARVAGLVDTVVNNPDGTSGTFTNSYTYINPPLLLSDVPASCSTTASVYGTYNCDFTVNSSIDAPTIPIYANTSTATGGTTSTSSAWVSCSFSSPTLSCNNIPAGNSNGTRNVLLVQQASLPNPSDTGTAHGTVNISTTPILNGYIASTVCTSPVIVSGTTSCTINLNSGYDFAQLTGNIDLRIGATGTVSNCSLPASGTTQTCTGVAVGSGVGLFTSQYSASGSGGVYLNGNNVTVTLNVVTSGLQLYYDADNNGSYPGSGQVITDLSGNNNNATLGANSGVSADDPTYTATGIKRFSLNGTSQFIASSLLSNFSNNVTLEGWFARSSSSSAGTFNTLINTARADGNTRLSTGISGTNIQSKVGTGVGISQFDSTFVAGTNWQHVVVSYDNTTGSTKTYVNGSLYNTSTASASPPASVLTAIGCKYSGSACSEYFAGDVAVVKVYNRVLTPVEISQNFNTEKDRFGFTASSVSTSGIPVSVVFTNANILTTTQNTSATLTGITFTDRRTNTAPWTATISTTNFTNGTYIIPSSKLSLNPGSLTVTSGSSANFTVGGIGSFGNPGEGRSLLSNSAADGGGSFVLNPQISIQIPAYARSGSYTGTISISVA